jgi:cell cycle arrest protein BUB2
MAWKLIDSKESKTKGWRSPEAGSITGAVSSPDNSFASNGSPPTHTAAESDQQVGYKQGMNVLAGVFLYAARSEAQAFVAFEKLVTRECPGYVRGTMEGVHKGLELVDEVLEICDPKLAAHLLSKGLTAKIYGFASVLTMCACTAPLPEVLKLWDFLFAYGPHLNIVCIVAQLVLIRDRLLAAERYVRFAASALSRLTAYSPNSLLRTLPNLQAEKIKALTISFIPKIPDDLYGRLLEHAK